MSVNPRNYADSRDVPKYTLQQVAWYLDIPIATLRWWCLGRDFKIGGKPRHSDALITPALYNANSPSLSFYNLAEIHILVATRRFHKISMPKIRDAIDYLEGPSKGQVKHPLLSQEFFTDGKGLFVKHLLETVNLGKKGQLAFKELVDQHLERIVPDATGRPEKLYPVRHGDLANKSVIIIPTVGSGHPVTTRKGIRVSALWNRKQAGESLTEIADDYGLTQIEVEEAIRYVEAA